MKKTISLLKAMLSQDMSLFKVNVGKKSSRLTKILVPVFLFLTIAFMMGVYAYKLADLLKPLKLTYIMLTVFMLLIIFLTFTEGIYKSQNMLFEAKDNDMLLSLPVDKKIVLLTRVLKLLIFEFLFNLMFILPAMVVYIIFEKTGISYYFSSILMLIILPIIPTIIACLIGYFIKMISSKFKSKKVIQTIITFVFFMIIFLGSLNIERFIPIFLKNAKDINDIITKIYYPIGLYIKLITKFRVLDLLLLILINILFLVVFLLLCDKYYYKIISKFNDKVVSDKKIKSFKIKEGNKMISLLRKEIKRYFSSTVYMFNTSFGLLLMVIMTFVLVFKGKSSLTKILSMGEVSSSISLTFIFYLIILFGLIMTSISSSSISLEGKTIEFTKSMPIDYKEILKSKILLCLVIEFPLVLCSLLLFIIKVKVSILFIIEIILSAFFVILLSASIGLIVNLKYPKLDASNDTEVVKQSMSSMVSVLFGILVLVLSTVYFLYFYDKIKLNLLIIIHICLIIIISIISYLYLMIKGPREYYKLNV